MKVHSRLASALLAVGLAGTLSMSVAMRVFADDGGKGGGRGESPTAVSSPGSNSNSGSSHQSGDHSGSGKPTPTGATPPPASATKPATATTEPTKVSTVTAEATGAATRTSEPTKPATSTPKPTQTNDGSASGAGSENRDDRSQTRAPGSDDSGHRGPPSASGTPIPPVGAPRSSADDADRGDHERDLHADVPTDDTLSSTIEVPADAPIVRHDPDRRGDEGRVLDPDEMEATSLSG